MVVNRSSMMMRNIGGLSTFEGTPRRMRVMLRESERERSESTLLPELVDAPPNLEIGRTT
jgi:hypothetical protein